MNNMINSKVLHLEFGDHAGLYVSRLSRMGKTWLTYGVFVRPGHPYHKWYDWERGDVLPNDAIDKTGSCIDGVPLHYEARWFVGDLLGFSDAPEMALAYARELLSEIDVM